MRHMHSILRAQDCSDCLLRLPSAGAFVSAMHGAGAADGGPEPGGQAGGRPPTGSRTQVAGRVAT